MYSMNQKFRCTKTNYFLNYTLVTLTGCIILCRMASSIFLKDGALQNKHSLFQAFSFVVAYNHLFLFKHTSILYFSI